VEPVEAAEKMDLKKLWPLALAFLFAFPHAVLCRDEDEPGVRERLERWVNSQDRAFGGSYSQVMFEMEAFEDFFDQEMFPMVRCYSSWYPLDNLFIELSLGGMYETGKAVGLVTGEESEEDVQFYVVPVQLNLGYSFNFWEDQWVVPQVWGGGDWWYFQEINDFGDNVDGEKTGWHYGASLGFLLDALDPRSAARMKRLWGIEDTYLMAVYEQAFVGENDDGIEFSGSFYSLGIRFEISGRSD